MDDFLKKICLETKCQIKKENSHFQLQKLEYYDQINYLKTVN